MKTMPNMKLSSLAEYIHVKTQEASQNTDFDERTFLAIDERTSINV